VIVAESIATQRLSLLPLDVSHADEMAGVLADPALYTFTGGGPPSVAGLRDRYARMLAGPGEPGVSWCNWVIEFEGRLVGTVQATVVPGERGQVAEIAWVVGVPWQGRGIAGEAAGGLVAWLAPRVIEIVAHVHPEHAASNGVARGVGMTPTHVWHDGERLWHRSGSQAGAAG